MEAIFVIDNLSRINSVVDVAELKRFNIQIISELKDVLDLDYKDTPVVVLDGFVQAKNGLSELILYKTLLGLNYIFISSNLVLSKQIEPYAKVFSFDTSQVGYNMIAAAVNDDKEACSQFSIDNVERFSIVANMVLDNPALVDDNLRDLSTALVAMIDTYHRDVITKDSLINQLDEATSLNRNIENMLHHLSNYVDDIMKQSIRVNKSLREYSFICQKSVYEKINLTEYKNRPNIIYFKEYGDFIHLTSFIHTLAETLKIQYDMPTKVLWIVDKNNPMKIPYVPEYYTIFSDGVYSKPRIHISDYMCTTGGYVNILRTICGNQSSIKNLIIVDSKLVNDTVLHNSDVLKIDLCRSKSKLKAYDLFSNRAITNGDGYDETGDSMEWSHYYDYEVLSLEERFLYLSNRPVIKQVCDLILRTFNTI